MLIAPVSLSNRTNDIQNVLTAHAMRTQEINNAKNISNKSTD